MIYGGSISQTGRRCITQKGDAILSYIRRTENKGTVIPVAITAIYPSKQGVSDLGYTQAHVSFRR